MARNSLPATVPKSTRSCNAACWNDAAGNLRKQLDYPFIKPAARALQPWRHVTHETSELAISAISMAAAAPSDRITFPFYLTAVCLGRRVFDWCAPIAVSSTLWGGSSSLEA